MGCKAARAGARRLLASVLQPLALPGPARFGFLAYCAQGTTLQAYTSILWPAPPPAPSQTPAIEQ